MCALELYFSTVGSKNEGAFVYLSEMKKEGERQTERQIGQLGGVGCSANICE